jgi:hypothetical protein
MSVVAVLLQLLAVLGAGALALRALGLQADFPVRERALWAFALGVGVLGWLVFPLARAGFVGQGALLAIEAILALGAALLWPDLRQIPRPKPARWGWLGWTLGLVAVVAVGFDLAEALAPPLDADSLAYHFAAPKQILREGGLRFSPTAGDRAGLTHMTYLTALAGGGERALTLWAMASGWAAPLFLYVVARRWLAPSWAAAAALLLATTPAWIYGGGSGQVEPRLALFAFAGLLAAAEARRTGSLRHAALAGLMAGFYAAAKLSGLIFVAAAGLVVVGRRNLWRPALTFAAAAVVAGFQWYAWSYAESGDPIFPGLFSILGVRDPSWWNATADATFREFLAAERPAKPAILWLFAYPFAASTGLGFQFWDAGRTGFGPFGLLVLPFALGGLWRFRGRIGTSPLVSVAGGVLSFYILWILAGPSQRIRHFLPFLPAFLLCATVAAARFAADVRRERFLAAATAIALAVHLAAGALYALPYLRRMATDESREVFLERHLMSFAAARWINANLSPSDRILVTERQLIYYLDRPALYLLPVYQAEVDLRDINRDVRGQWNALGRRGATHLLLIPGLAVANDSSGLWRLGRALVEAGCAEGAAAINVRRFVSRTLPGWNEALVPADILKLRPDRCDPARLPVE